LQLPVYHVHRSNNVLGSMNPNHKDGTLTVSGGTCSFVEAGNDKHSWSAPCSQVIYGGCNQYLAADMTVNGKSFGGALGGDRGYQLRMEHQVSDCDYFASLLEHLHNDNR